MTETKTKEQKPALQKLRKQMNEMESKNADNIKVLTDSYNALVKRNLEIKEYAHRQTAPGFVVLD